LTEFESAPLRIEVRSTESRLLVIALAAPSCEDRPFDSLGEPTDGERPANDADRLLAEVLPRAEPKTGAVVIGPRAAKPRGFTNEELRKALQWLRANMTADDTALVLISCHGTLAGDERRLHLAGIDGRLADPQVSCVDFNHLFEQFLDDMPGQTLVALDCCHAGAATNVVSKGRRSAYNPLVLLCAVEAHQEMIRGGGDRAGELTKALVAALRSLNDKPWNYQQLVNGVLEHRERTIKHWIPQQADTGTGRPVPWPSLGAPRRAILGPSDQ
jgi:hypothetical protein